MFSFEQLLEILAALPDPAFVLTRSGRYVAIMGGTDARYYHDGSGLIGRRIGDVLEADKAAWFLREIDEALNKRSLHIVEYELAGSDVKGLPSTGPQQAIWFEGRIRALDFAIDGEEAVLWVASNITARHELEHQLRSLSETDALTGLWNRRHFAKIAAAEAARALRYEHPVSLLVFDVDHFKAINDTCGHHVGDAVLGELARVVVGCTRDSDSVTRWGGEEFIVLMPYAPLVTAAEAGEKLRQVVAHHRFANGLQVTVSVGVAQWALRDETVDSAISRADEALYSAKRQGRNRVVASPPSAVRESPAGHGPRQRLRWRKHYESGDAELDRQHQEIFEQAQRLIQLARTLPKDAAEGPHADELAALADRLLANSERHFHSEETKLAQCDWPLLETHREEHRQLMARARALRRSLAGANLPEVAKELVNFLVIDVVVNHLLLSDRKYFALFRPA